MQHEKLKIIYSNAFNKTFKSTISFIDFYNFTLFKCFENFACWGLLDSQNFSLKQAILLQPS